MNNLTTIMKCYIACQVIIGVTVIVLFVKYIGGDANLLFPLVSAVFLLALSMFCYQFISGNKDGQ